MIWFMFVANEFHPWAKHFYYTRTYFACVGGSKELAVMHESYSTATIVFCALQIEKHKSMDSMCCTNIIEHLVWGLEAPLPCAVCMGLPSVLCYSYSTPVHALKSWPIGQWCSCTSIQGFKGKSSVAYDARYTCFFSLLTNHTVRGAREVL